MPDVFDWGFLKYGSKNWEKKMCNCNPSRPVCSCAAKDVQKFDPKVGEVYQTENKLHKIRIIATDIKNCGQLCTAIAYKADNKECITILQREGYFLGSKLVLFKEPRTRTVWVNFYDNGIHCSYSNPNLIHKPIGRKRVTMIEGEFDE